MSVTAPEIGELLSVRGRPWVATDICQPHTMAGDGQSLMDLFGVSDGGHSTALKMVWEVEPGLGALTTPTVPEVIAAGSDALRLGGMMSCRGKQGTSSHRLSVMLRDEPTIRPNLYRLPAEPLASDILIPAFRQATSVRGAFGWFSAGWIRTLAAGLAVYLARSDVQPMEFTIAPALFTSERVAIERAVLSPEAAVQRVEEEILLATQPDAGALANHAVDCLTWMIARNRLFLSIAVPIPGANYHPKIWLFSDGHDSVAVRGSANATGRAQEAAIEHMDVDCTWVSSTRVRAAEAMVNDWAAGRDPVLERTVPLPVALRERLLRIAPSEPPEQADYERAVARSESAMMPTPVRRIFAIPRGLEWRSGKYRQQGEAVDAWESAGRRGILAMATGAGKTIAALISAYRAWQEHDGPFLLVVSAPTTALVLQWNAECKRFGLAPLNPSPGTAAGRDILGNMMQRLRSQQIRGSRISSRHERCTHYNLVP